MRERPEAALGPRDRTSKGAGRQSTQAFRQLRAVGDIEVGRLQVGRPGRLAAVYPGGAQARGARRRDIEQRIIAHIENVPRLEVEVARELLEAAGMRFRGTDLP